MHIPETTPRKYDHVWFSVAETPYISSEENTQYLFREMNIERRTEVRLDVQEGVYAVMDSYSPQICAISDMGPRGMSYIYFKDDDDMKESQAMDILVTGFGFCLEQIPFKKVADYKAFDDQGTGRFEKRVACVEFINLSDEQKEKINAFIIKHIEKTVN